MSKKRRYPEMKCKERVVTGRNIHKSIKHENNGRGGDVRGGSETVSQDQVDVAQSMCCGKVGKEINKCVRGMGP